MKITICTLFEEMFEPFFMTSIIKRANLQEFVELKTVNIRDYTIDKHNRVDDAPYGGGAGLVMKAQPILDMLKDIRKPTSRVIYLTPVAPVYNQTKAKELAKVDDIILLCGHYEGVDERVLNYVDEVLSIGDYVLTGGEVAAMVVVDSIVRLLDGVIKKESTMDESFESSLLEYPQYTRPEVIEGHRVPDVLISGHHKNIEVWRLKESIRKTYQYRKDLLKKAELDKLGLQLLEEVKSEEDDNH